MFPCGWGGAFSSEQIYELALAVTPERPMSVPVRSADRRSTEEQPTSRLDSRALTRERLLGEILALADDRGTREFMALHAIATHHGRPGHADRPGAHRESLFGHVKHEWPHLCHLTDPAASTARSTPSGLERARAASIAARRHPQRELPP
jgi:hypothetical protein